MLNHIKNNQKEKLLNDTIALATLFGGSDDNLHCCKIHGNSDILGGVSDGDHIFANSEILPKLSDFVLVREQGSLAVKRYSELSPLRLASRNGEAIPMTEQVFIGVVTHVVKEVL